MFYGLGRVHHDKVESSRWQNGVSKYQWLGPESNQIAWLRASCINCLDGCLNDYLRIAHHVAIVLLMHPFSDLAVFSCHNCTIWDCHFCTFWSRHRHCLRSQNAWEQRKLGETFLFKKNNTFSRSELSFENGYVKNIHYGDILVKYNEYLNVHNNSNIPFVTQNIPSNFSSSYLQDGDIVMADTAEDETVGKSTEISSLSSNDRVLAGLHTIPLSPKQKFGSGFLGFYLNSNSYHDKLRPFANVR